MKTKYFISNIISKTFLNFLNRKDKTMKTKYFLTTAIFTLCVLLTACSENPLVTSDSNNKNLGKNYQNNEQGSMFWTCKNLSVSEKGESNVTNQVTSPSLPGSIRSIKITFKAATNSISFPNNIANLSIFETGDLRRMPAFNDDNLIYSQNDIKSLNGYQELNFNISEGLIINGHGVKIVVSLFSVDRPTQGDREVTYLELKDINIYTKPCN
jgi:hypothetical protein